MAKKRGKKASRSSRSRSKVSELPLVHHVIASERKINLVTSNLIMFAIVFLISEALYWVFRSDDFYGNLFWVASMITGFLSLALLIVYFILLVVRYLDK